VRLKLLLLFCLVFLFLGCYKIVESDHKRVDGFVSGKYHKDAWLQMIPQYTYNGKTSSMRYLYINHPEINEVTFSCTVSDFKVDDFSTFSDFKQNEKVTLEYVERFKVKYSHDEEVSRDFYDYKLIKAEHKNES